jgi:hypothetical protein
MPSGFPLGKRLVGNAGSLPQLALFGYARDLQGKMAVREGFEPSGYLGNISSKPMHIRLTRKHRGEEWLLRFGLPRFRRGGVLDLAR